MPETQLARLFASLAQREIFKNPDLLIANEDPLDPVDIFVDLGNPVFKAPEPSLANMVYDGARGVALVTQIIKADNNAIIRCNRPTGPTFEAKRERIYHRKIRRLFVHSAEGDGTLHIRLYIDPAIMLVSSPELSISTVQVENTNGILINPLDVDTFTAQIGEVQATPTANTVLGRLKDVTDKTAKLEAFDLKSSVAYGQVTVGTTVVNLPNVTVPYGKSVILKALITNTGKIYIGGGTGVTTGTGFEIAPGELSPPLMVTNLNVLYAIADAASQKLCYIIEQ